MSISQPVGEYFTTSECICSLRCPACNAHGPCHLWPVRLYNIFPHYLVYDTVFREKKLLNAKCVFRFSLQLLYETFLILRTTEQDIFKKCIFAFM